MFEQLLKRNELKVSIRKTLAVYVLGHDKQDNHDFNQSRERKIFKFYQIVNSYMV